MVCPKLVDGTCRLTKKTCIQPYEIKMIRYKDCKIYKRRPSKTVSEPARSKKPKKKVKTNIKNKSKIRSLYFSK